jgi:hypothetical protein
MEAYMKNPLSAAGFAALITMFAVYFTKGTSSKEILPNSAYTRPALFVGLLVYFIVYTGNGKYETISKEPF